MKLQIYHLGMMGSVFALAIAMPAQAQDSATEEQANDAAVAADAAASEEETVIIVTGTAGGASLRKQDASFAITAVSADALAEAAPKSTAEVFTLVPGVWAESSGGKSGANIDVRGLPGGGDAPFVTLAIGGAPLYGTPTLSFFEQTSIFRTDETIVSVEALRGGPNAVFGRGEPGVTMNFRLKEGSASTEGLVKLSTSDYGLKQIDAVISGPIATDLYYMVGGYWSQSHGIRDAQFDSERGKQLTANITYEPTWGKLGVFTRWTNDVGQWYLPMSLVSGNDLGTFSQLGNATRYRTLTIDRNGTTKEFDFRHGRGWKGSISGLNLEIDVSDALTLRDNMAYTNGNADTYGLVPDGAPVLVSALADPSVSTRDGTLLAGSEYVQNYGHWVVEKDIKSFTNDLSLAWKTGGNTLTAGFYRADFSSNDFWTLGNFTPLHNVQNGDFLESSVTCADLQAAGSGSGCWRFGLRSEGDATVNALYLADSLEVTDKFRIDAGVRREWLSIDYLLDTGPGYPDGTIDMDRNLKASDWAYTFAANYAFNDMVGIFARYSDGFTMPHFDDVRENNLNVNAIKQSELGFKLTGDYVSLFATFFHNTNDSFSSVVGGVQGPTAFKTRANGVELDGNLNWGGFSLNVLATYQDAKVTDSSDPGIVGNRILRQPKFQFRASPSYEVELGGVTATLYGALSNVGDRYGDLANSFELAGFTKVDMGIKVEADSGIFGQIHADNLFDSHGLTEGDPRSLTGANGRPILGRSFRFSIGYKF